MKSIKELFRIGRGPSSSHTIGPQRASEKALAKHPNAHFKVTLYGSLASTGKGHLTDVAIQDVLGDQLLEIIWKPADTLPQHPNGMCFEALDDSGELVDKWQFYSTGGGALSDDAKNPDIYPLTTMTDILQYCDETGESMWEYVERYEGQEIWEYLSEILRTMREAVERGLKRDGVLPGGLGIARKARSFYRKTQMLGRHFQEDGKLAAYTHAVSEENACGGTVVTAPTCGASGVLPGVLHYLREITDFDRTEYLQALAIAGLIGNIAKENGSISGAQVGCQGEVGVACAMAAAAATHLLGGTSPQIEYAAEMGLEHHLGLSCDPVAGLVQIPCIERNAHAAVRAMSCCHLALLSDGVHKISYDDVVAVMLETGIALPNLYRETSGGGLAKIYKKR